MKNNIILKINALLAKTTDNGASKAEMESALEKANELMLKHFISEHDLNQTIAVEKCSSRTIDRVKSSYDIDGFSGFLAKLFDCKAYFNKDKQTFFGYNQDTELCEYFYILIIKTILHEVEIFKKSSNYKSLSHRYHGRSLVSSFVNGFVHEVQVELEDMYNQRESSLPQSVGLMVISKKNDIEEQYKAISGLFRKKYAQTKRVEMIAFECGAEKGKEILLTQALKPTPIQSQLFI